MSAIINLSLNLENLPKEKFVKGKKGTYYNLTVSVNDETNDYGSNVSAYDSQTKEERDAKKTRNYIGNGKVVWTDGKCTAVVRDDEPKKAQKEVVSASDDLPF
jgi:hypothetical protein